MPTTADMAVLTSEQLDRIERAARELMMAVEATEENDLDLATRTTFRNARAFARLALLDITNKRKSRRG